jgi:hypothetical protein
VIGGIHIEVLLAAAYAVFLGGVAAVLEWVARHSYRRAEQYEQAGFTYHRQMDLWKCPAGEQLQRAEIEHQLRVVRYRARAKTCNACSLKTNCTDSDEGREIEQRLDSWVGSELRRFHRGISLMLLLLAAMIVAAETWRHDSHRELAMLGSLLAMIGIAGSKLLKEFLERRENSSSHAP